MQDDMDALVIGDDGEPQNPDITAKQNGRSTIFDELKRDFENKGEAKRIVYPHPNRDGYEVEYRNDIDYDMLQQWSKRSLDKGTVGGLHELRLASIILANQCRAIYRNGERVEHHGEPVTFTMPEFQELLGASSATEAVRAFYGLDGTTVRMGQRLLRDSGYGDDVLGNPTTSS